MKTPSPHSLMCGRLRFPGVREADNLNPVPPTHSGMKIPQIVFRVRKLRSSEKSDYLQVTQEVRGMYQHFFEHSLWARSSVGRGVWWGGGRGHWGGQLLG